MPVRKLLAAGIRGHFLGKSPRRCNLFRSGAYQTQGKDPEQAVIFEEEGIIDNARRLGTDVIGPALRALVDRHPSVGEVRGLGCFWAIELVRSKATREPLVPYNAAGPAAAPVNEVVAVCKREGVWPFSHFNRIHVCPPLITSDDDVRHGIEVIDAALAEADKYVST